MERLLRPTEEQAAWPVGGPGRGTASYGAVRRLLRAAARPTPHHARPDAPHARPDERRTAMAPPFLPRPLHRPPPDAREDRSSAAGGPGPGRGARSERAGRPVTGVGLPASDASFDLPARPSSVGAARRAAGDLLTVWGVPEGVRDDVVLVVSELVTNALVHAGGTRIGCRLRRTAERIRVEVADETTGDAGSVLLVSRRPGAEDQHGRGLLLVESLSLGWGVTLPADRPARVVWAELRSV
ncbi:ATP-binding protein [Streptomyces malaysiense]|uniref:ATP-binding protein n=1 Tax=Streptomyces malaysiense TaxID=1428626 RepID=UPI00069CEBE0|nr:ATP-binding protein [Streptomyces malaysiense]